MYNEEKCPNCDSGDYEIMNCEDDYPDDNHYCREWYCECGNCHSEFIITETYKLESVEVSAN